MKRIVFWLACWTVLSLNVQAGVLYRWVDQSGNVHYGDVPAADAKQIEARKFSDAITPGADLPYETRSAQQNFPVTLYVSDNCAETCDQARGLLNRRGIPFSEKALRTKQDLDAFKQLSGIDSFVPVLAVGKKFLKGYLASQWDGELDIAGYPKTAPYRAQILPLAPAAASQVTPANPVAP